MLFKQTDLLGFDCVREENGGQTVVFLLLVLSPFGEWRFATRRRAPAWRQTQTVYRRGGVRLLLLLR